MMQKSFSQQGQAAVETAILLLVMVVLLSGAMTIGPLTYTHVGVLTAAENCAIAAAQTLDPSQGRYQGISAAQETLAAYRLRAASAGISVFSTWERGAPVECTVEYEVDLSSIPLAGMFNPETHVYYTVVLPAQSFKSVWR